MNGEHSHDRRIDVESLKQTVNLVEVMQSTGLALTQVGNKPQWKAHCPFGTHPDKTPSLNVSPDKGLWNCFGCDAGGNVLNWLQLQEGLAFLDGVAWLRQQGFYNGDAPHPNGHTIPARLPASPAQDSPAPVTVPPDLLGRVAEHYARCFRESTGAQSYLASRGLSNPELWDAFQVGFSDGSLLKKLPEVGELKDALTTLGILTAKGKEHFLGCVVVPLSHPDHGVVGLYGRRITEGTLTHMYLPGPQRGVLHWQALHASRQVVLAESVLDAMSLWQAGIHNVTCLYGVKNLPPDLDALLGRYSITEVRFCLDADLAGQTATERLATALVKRGIRCATIALPDGHDPNSLLAAYGTDALRQAVQTVTPFPSRDEVKPEVQPTGDGFLMHFGDLTYRVTPRPPFKGHLKVTLRATQGDDTLYDTQDLYLARNRAALASQLQRTFMLARTEAERHLLVLIEKVEAWVQALDKPGETSPFPVPTLSADEKADAMTLLQAPDLVTMLLEDMEALGYVGEEKAKLLAYLISISRRLDKPMAGIILSQSGAGKSTMTELVEALCPPEDICLFSRLSALALAYMPKDFIKRKLLILEERTGGEAADYSIRVLLSRHKFSQAVVVKDPSSGSMQTQTFEVEGPIAYLETTTNPHVNEENASRCFTWGVDESEAQTARIHAIQRARRSREGLSRNPDIEDIKKRHQNAQRLLEPVKVLISFGHLLTFPTRWLRTRRDNERFLSLVEAIAFLHQHQRQREVITHPKGDIVCVEATVEDYRLAYTLARDVLGASLHELTRGAQDLWVEARALVTALKGARRNVKVEDLTFTRKTLRDHCGWPDRRLREALAELVDMEYVGTVSGSQGKTYLYRLMSDAETTPSPLGQLTTPEQLEALLRKTA